MNRILNISDLPSQRIIYHFNEDEEKENIMAEIEVDADYQKAHLIVYKPLYTSYLQKSFDEIQDVLCHEIGHIHTDKLFNLVERPYKTQNEVIDTEENLVTKIGYYLFKLLDRGGK